MGKSCRALLAPAPTSPSAKARGFRGRSRNGCWGQDGRAG